MHHFGRRRRSSLSLALSLSLSLSLARSRTLSIAGCLALALALTLALCALVRALCLSLPPSLPSSLSFVRGRALPFSPSNIRSTYCLLRSLTVRRRRRNMSNTFTCPLFKRSWVLDAAGLRTLRTRYKSAHFPPRVVHRSSLSSDTSLTHVLSLKLLADTSERAGAHSHSNSLSLSRS
jgi:hypothetical protein